MENELQLGQYAVPVILMVIMGVIYQIVPKIQKRWKPIIAIGVGIGLGLVALGYKGLPWSFPNIVDFVFYGLMTGASAIGLYEGARAFYRPRQSTGSNGRPEQSPGIKRLALLMLIFFFISGCAAYQESAIEWGQADVQNAEASRKLAKDLLSIWELNSGFIRGALGDRINELPYQAVKAMDELDKLAQKKDLADRDLGRSLGLRIRMLDAIVRDTLKRYAPHVLEYLAFL